MPIYCLDEDCAAGLACILLCFYRRFSIQTLLLSICYILMAVVVTLADVLGCKSIGSLSTDDFSNCSDSWGLILMLCHVHRPNRVYVSQPFMKTELSIGAKLWTWCPLALLTQHENWIIYGSQVMNLMSFGPRCFLLVPHNVCSKLANKSSTLTFHLSAVAVLTGQTCVLNFVTTSMVTRCGIKEQRLTPDGLPRKVLAKAIWSPVYM
jgi:hypothetical protein